jgi:hypothetical protein
MLNQNCYSTVRSTTLLLIRLLLLRSSFLSLAILLGEILFFSLVVSVQPPLSRRVGGFGLEDLDDFV